jgi:hypothetical protein
MSYDKGGSTSTNQYKIHKVKQNEVSVFITRIKSNSSAKVKQNQNKSSLIFYCSIIVQSKQAVTTKKNVEVGKSALPLFHRL